ncbi:unnamed protein product [Penicillium egyptiacum]|uniref:Uncharacterized protein n=1 Tax=Penicillium egyptiacum TaxID=1303716 RepID=A0A9W4KA10_9EURO|nr:unnamed protein product [Penicillium egyptiacum]
MLRELEKILYPPTKDEQIVNTALIVFLNALTIHFSLSLDWTLHRKSFTAAFKDTVFQARMDGYLDDSHGTPSESAQMVAWIKRDTNQPKDVTRCKRLHISQDRHEVYVTVAKYDERYLNYLDNTHPSSENDNRPFLTIRQYGPWNTLENSHIRDLGLILLAISLQADDDRKANLP